MKSLLNSFITNFNSKTSAIFLQKTNQLYLISPPIPYISQFVELLPQSFSISDPIKKPHLVKIYGAKNTKEFTFWAWRNCGIACVAMILHAYGKANNKTMMDLTREGEKLGGYIVYKNGEFVDLGWFHHALVQLLKNYGLLATTKRWQSLETVTRDILANKKVILSVLVPDRKHIVDDGSFRPKPGAKYGGHLLVATGVEIVDGNVKGIFVHDPRGLKTYQKDTYILASVFLKIFTNRTIVTDSLF